MLRSEPWGYRIGALCSRFGHLMKVMSVSERFACRVTGQNRTTQRHEPAAATAPTPMRCCGRGFASEPKTILGAGSARRITTRARRGLELIERSVTTDVLIDELDRLAAQRGYLNINVTGATNFGPTIAESSPARRSARL